MESDLPGGVELVIVLALIGLLPAWIASRKGYNFLTWWIFGGLLFIIALPLALMMKPDAGKRRQCPACLSWVDREASVCAHCGRDLPEPAPHIAPHSTRPWEREP